MMDALTSLPGLVVMVLLFTAVGLFVFGLLNRKEGEPASEDWDDDHADDDLVAQALAEDFDPGSAELGDDGEDDVLDHVRMPEPTERMVALSRYSDRFQADLHRTVLLDAGIWCAIDGDMNQLATIGLSRATLNVPEGDLPRARDLLADHDPSLGADLQTCPACGYDLRATPDRCPECGLRFTDSDETSGDGVTDAGAEGVDSQRR